jgi:DNA topoisomerase-3
MNATRLYTLKYGKNKQVLSIGRVQTPTLALIVKRHLEIANFVPQPYWELKTVYRDTTFSVTEGRFDSEEKGREALDKITGEPFTVTDVTAKNGTESAPKLYDLTSLQVDCNKKFGLSAEQTLQTIQSLYEKKVTTYPRVDTTFLSDDIYPKCTNILKGLRDYQTLTTPLMDKPLIKSKKVFDNKKVTDHHAIIPTGVYPQGLTDLEKKVYNLVATHFIAVFYPECKFQTTTIYGESAEIPFKASGRKIIDPGWKAIFQGESNDEKEEKEITSFTKGESGPHLPELLEKWTQPPKPYTEGTLVRAMETAGKFVDDEELRDAMKEQGIGRPATRAEIIKTLYKRNYIQKVKKNITATQTGIELIATIRNELLKSAELTGQWEKKLRDIEKRQYEAKTFIEELKVMLTSVVNDVLRDNGCIG